MKAIALILLACVLAAAKEPPRQTSPQASPRRQQNSPAAGAATTTNPAGNAELQGLTADVERMKSLLQQMQMNLAFVTPGQNPLKHQFELEIDMWGTVIGAMERRVERLREQLGTAPQQAPGTAPKSQP